MIDGCFMPRWLPIDCNKDSKSIHAPYAAGRPLALLETMRDPTRTTFAGVGSSFASVGTMYLAERTDTAYGCIKCVPCKSALAIL